MADDHPEFRQELRGLVDRFANFIVVGEAPDGASAVRLVREREPDIVLMDLNMPSMNGCEATAEIVKLRKAPAVIVMTASSTSTDVLEAIIAGASGYLLKGASPDDIETALHAAVEGGAPLSPEVAGALVQHVRERRDQKAAPYQLPPLTQREAKMLELLACGCDNKQIADELFVSLATVKNTMPTMFRKLDVDSRAQAAVVAVAAGLV